MTADIDWKAQPQLIAILRGIRPSEAIDHIAALVEAGLTLIEIPTNSPDWAESIGAAARTFSGKAVIGAGTVVEIGQLYRIGKIPGARLIVTPNTDAAIIERARALGMITCIGCATATEAFRAISAGANAIKLFPAGELGPGYVRALKAVLPPNLPVFAVGGVTPHNLKMFLAAGCAGAGLGSDLFKPGQSVERTSEQARTFMAVWTSWCQERTTTQLK
jgi:2-dehydro-3-deoxyphosphogalactonate aldolase